MTRSLQVAAAVALLSIGGAAPRSSEEYDDAKERGAREAEERGLRERVEARRAATTERARRERADFEKLRAGIDPTNGRPLSRQQRRFLSSRNFPFLGDAA